MGGKILKLLVTVSLIFWVEQLSSLSVWVFSPGLAGGFVNSGLNNFAYICFATLCVTAFRSLFSETIILLLLQKFINKFSIFTEVAETNITSILKLFKVSQIDKMTFMVVFLLSFYPQTVTIYLAILTACHVRLNIQPSFSVI